VRVRRKSGGQPAAGPIVRTRIPAQPLPTTPGFVHALNSTLEQSESTSAAALHWRVLMGRTHDRKDVSRPLGPPWEGRDFPG